MCSLLEIVSLSVLVTVKKRSLDDALDDAGPADSIGANVAKRRRTTHGQNDEPMRMNDQLNAFEKLPKGGHCFFFFTKKNPKTHRKRHTSSSSRIRSMLFFSKQTSRRGFSVVLEIPM